MLLLVAFTVAVGYAVERTNRALLAIARAVESNNCAVEDAFARLEWPDEGAQEPTAEKVAWLDGFDFDPGDLTFDE